MRLAQRLILNTFFISALTVGVVLLVLAQRSLARQHVDAAATVGVRHPESDGETRSDFLIAGALLVGAAVGYAAFLAARLATPIEQLRDVARAIARGDLARRPTLAGDGEIGELADALRRMAELIDLRAQELEAEESLLVALTDSLNEGVIAVDRRQQVVRVNETARALLRLREPVPFPADYLPRDRTLREALTSVLSGADAVPGEVRVDDRTLSLAARPLPGGGAVIALYDLTPFRRLEAVRRDFVANVSHELRTPLTVISGFIETLQDDDLPPDLRTQFMGMAAGNVRRMQRIVDDLLDLSRIESGGWLPNAAELDIAALANEIVSPMRDAAEAKGIAIGISVADDARCVYADPTAARQVFSNLAENALRHTTVGEIRLFAEAEGDGVWIGVRDTGSGIPESHLSRIFERFYRADPGRSREAGGTGLGLAIVKHLVEAHDGRVRAESTLDSGTTIAAWFPKARERSVTTIG